MLSHVVGVTSQGGGETLRDAATLRVDANCALRIVAPVVAARAVGVDDVLLAHRDDDAV